MIGGVVVHYPKMIADARGAVMRMLRTDDPHFAGFGEIYFSLINPGVVKGWKRHHTMTMTLAVPVGRVLLVLYDDRPESSTSGVVQEIELGPHDYKSVTVPPMVWTAFMGLGSSPSVVANCASILHDPNEADGRELADPRIPYVWPATAARC
jgi:dTDP-4-dehydrorhamnose 3,5-epimerase